MLNHYVIHIQVPLVVFYIFIPLQPQKNAFFSPFDIEKRLWALLFFFLIKNLINRNL